MSKIASAFDHGKAFIPFITCGDPDLETTEDVVLAAVENGADTLEEVQQITGASTVCGACLGDVERLVNFFLAQRGKENQ